MYFPWGQVAPSYWNLDFVGDRRKTRAGAVFLQTYTDLTRRVPRNWTQVKKPVSAGNINVSTSNLDHRMINDRMINDRMINDRMEARIRVHSMRNPPDVFVPDACVKTRQRQ